MAIQLGSQAHSAPYPPDLEMSEDSSSEDPDNPWETVGRPKARKTAPPPTETEVKRPPKKTPSPKEEGTSIKTDSERKYNAHHAFMQAQYVDHATTDNQLIQRRERTVMVHLPEEGKPYKRTDFTQHLKSTGSLGYLEACGPTMKANIWQFTFDNKGTKEHFLEAGDFQTNRGHTAIVMNGRKTRAQLKVHWVPYDVPMAEVVKDLMRAKGADLIDAGYELSREDGFEHVRTGVRLFTVEVDNSGEIPHFIRWKHGGQSGKALVTMRGRPSLCLRCRQKGHLKRDCKAPSCDKCKKVGHAAENCSNPANGSRSFASVISGAAQEVEEEGDDPEMDQDPPVNIVVPSSSTPAEVTTVKNVTEAIDIEPPKLDVIVVNPLEPLHCSQDDVSISPAIAAPIAQDPLPPLIEPPQTSEPETGAGDIDFAVPEPTKKRTSSELTESTPSSPQAPTRTVSRRKSQRPDP
jgi:hypothetical protein